MAEVETATAITPSVSTSASFVIQPATESDSAGQAFNGVFGFWVSDPLVLPGTPVTASMVRWSATVPAGCTLTVQTSINNGASWDLASNNTPIARLREGDTTTLFVLARITMTRPTSGSTSPKVTSFEFDVSTDASVDEMVAVGYGMIDKVTVHAVAGATGGGSTTNVPSSAAVISKGGGQVGGGTSITVHVSDLSRAIKRNVWQQPFTVPSGMNYGDAAKAMVLDRLPSQTAFSLSSTTRVLPDVVVYGLSQGGDPWQDISELAGAIGFECFFDPNGVFIFRPVPDPTTGDPVWVFDETSNPLVSEASRELSDEQTFNHIIVIGQSTSSQNAVSAEAFDNNPNSPTYILGPYGEVTERLTFSLINSQDQAQDAANAILNNSLAASDTVTIIVVPQPALEPGDIVKVNISDVNVDGNYMINSMTTSLSAADPQQLVCFRQSTN
jgi:Putative phage tail protein